MTKQEQFELQCQLTATIYNGMNTLRDRNKADVQNEVEYAFAVTEAIWNVVSLATDFDTND